MKCKGQKTVLNIPLKDQANAKESIKYLVSSIWTLNTIRQTELLMEINTFYTCGNSGEDFVWNSVELFGDFKN